MIRVCQILIFVLLSQTLFGQQKPKKIKFSKLNERWNVLYLKNNPLNGYYLVKYSKRKSEISNFSNGKREGHSKYLWLGKPEREGLYKNGLKEGLWKYYVYTSGDLLATTHYKNGKKDGKETFHESEKKVFNYKNGVLDGWQKKFNYKSELLSTESFYEDGDLKKSFYFFFDGSIEKECEFNNGNGSCVKFKHKNSGVENLQIKDSIFYKAGKKVALKSYVNDSIDFNIKIHTQEDTIRKSSDKILIASFYKSQKFIKSYIFYISSWCNYNNMFTNLTSLIIDSYSSFCHKGNIQNSYIDLCDVIKYPLFEEYDIINIYLKTDKDLVEYKDSDCYDGIMD